MWLDTVASPKYTQHGHFARAANTCTKLGTVPVLICEISCMYRDGVCPHPCCIDRARIGWKEIARARRPSSDHDPRKRLPVGTLKG